MTARILVFASGTESGGGSGFRALAESSLTGILNAKILCVVSQFKNGGVRQHANDLGIDFAPLNWVGSENPYVSFSAIWAPDLICFSGWTRRVSGLDPRKTINIHPAPLPKFGGKGFLGQKVHEEVLTAYRRGEIKETAVSMHFVTEELDNGPVFFHYPVLIRQEDDVVSLESRVKEIEHAWQPYITNLVVSGEISWNGKSRVSLKVPDNWPFYPKL